MGQLDFAKVIHEFAAFWREQGNPG